MSSGNPASAFAPYAEKYENLRMERSPEGILRIALHTDGGPFVFTGLAHRQFVQAFHDVASDRDNQVVILTGTGDAWLNQIDFPSLGPITTPQGWDPIYWEGKRLLENLLSIEVPVIAAVNGPATIHTEWLLTCDVILASETATFQDGAHIPGKIVPGDGVHVLWPMVLGPIRGSYFLWTAETLSASQALALGVVNEVLPADRLQARADELARQLVQLPPLTRRYTRVALNDRRRRLLQEGVGYGMALEGISAFDLPNQPAP